MDQLFYIAVNGQQTGPFSFDDLRTKNIQRDTLIWTEGLDSWTKAEMLPLVKDILRAIPPPLPNTESKSIFQQVPPSPISIPQQTAKYFGYELARRRERLFASIVESIIIAIPVLIIFTESISNNDPYSFGSIAGTTVLSAILGAIFYPMWSGNLGHKIMGIKVISSVDGTDQNKASEGAKREVLKNVFSLLILPVIWLLWDDNRQNLYDKVVNTYVVKKK